MANSKISALTSATTPLAGTETLPIVQSSTTKQVATNDLTVRNVRAAATTGILQVSGPTAGTTRTMTVPDANFTAARTDAAQSFSGLQTFGSGVSVTSGKVTSVYGAGGDFVALFQNTSSATPYCVWIKDASGPAAGYPLLNISDSAGTTTYFRVDSSNGDARIGIGNLVIGTSGKGITDSTGGTTFNFSSTQITANKPVQASEFKFSNGTSARPGGSGQYIVGADNGGFYQNAPNGSGSYYLVITSGGSTSDATLKTNVQQIVGSLDKVCAIRGVNFEFIEQPLSTSDQGIQLGVIAQEVEAQYPEIVVTDENGIKSVRYDRLVAPLIEAIKELKTELDFVKAEIAQLKIN